MLLNQKQAQQLLNKYSIKFPETLVFRTYNEIADKNIAYPCVLKVDSPQVMHKTELGLVFIDVTLIEELKQDIAKAEAILKEKQIIDYNFVLQEKLTGAEFIMGMKSDPTFGKVIVFGLGGIFVELIKDISMKIAPLEKKDCIDMIESTKAKKFIEGYRGFPKANKDKIIDLLLKLSKMAINEKNLVEIDFNPVIVNEKEAYVADARIISEENA